jgi:flagellar M-ring protein FliF
MVFDDSYQKKIEAEMAQAEAAARDRERFIAYVLAGGALLAVILILAVILLRRRSAQRVDEDREEGFIAVRDMEAEMEAEQGKEVGKDKQNQVRNIARDNPRELAEVLKVWIKDKG